MKPYALAAALLLTTVAVVAEDSPKFRLGLDALAPVFWAPSNPPDGGGTTEPTQPAALEIVAPQPEARRATELWSFIPKAKGGVGRHTWTVELPPNSDRFSYHPSTMTLYGATPWVGEYPFEVTVTDEAGASDTETIVARILPADGTDNPPVITPVGGDGTGGDMTDEDPDTDVGMGPGDYIDIDFDEPSILDNINLDIRPIGLCGLGSFVVKASYLDSTGNEHEIDRFEQNDINCIASDEPSPPPPIVWRIVDGTRWTVASGWYLRSTCGSYTPTIMTTMAWPSNSTKPAWNYRDAPHDVYVGDDCLGGQYMSAATEQQLKNSYSVGFWRKQSCLADGVSGCRYHHVRTYVRFLTTYSSTAALPSWKPVKFTGGAYRKIRLTVVSASPDTTLRMDNLKMAIVPQVKVAVAPSTKVRMPDTASIPYQTTGGKGAYTVSCTGLPVGMTCGNGVISGKPTAPGTYPVVVKAVDTANANNIAISTATITVVPELVASVGKSLSLDIGEQVRFVASATGSVGTVRWSLPEGAALPGSLSLSSNGIITGTVQTPGTWSGLRLVATDSEGGDTTEHFTIVVSDPAIAFDPNDPYGAHRYWGLEFISGGANNVYSVADLQFIDQPGGPDQTGGGTAYLTTTYGTDVAARAFDASTTTFASTNTLAPPQRLWYDFGAGNEVRVNEMKLTPRSQAGQTPREWKVIYSDDGNAWRTAWQVGETGGWTGGVTRTFASPDKDYVAPTAKSPYGKHRFWGVRFTAGGANSVYTIGGLQLRTELGGPSVAVGGSPGAPSHYTGMPPSYAFDGSTGTLYSATIASQQVLWYDFRAGHEVGISEIAIYPRGTSTQTPRGWDVVYSDDGETWYTAWSDTTPAWTAEWRAFVSPDIH